MFILPSTREDTSFPPMMILLSDDSNLQHWFHLFSLFYSLGVVNSLFIQLGWNKTSKFPQHWRLSGKSADCAGGGFALQDLHGCVSECKMGHAWEPKHLQHIRLQVNFKLVEVNT